MHVTCPECGALIEVHGRCWACRCCGVEDCGLAGLEVAIMHSIEDQLILHEGMRLKPYRCTAGKLTIGVGRNLEDKGITEDEALYMLRNDIKEITKYLERYSWYLALGPVRRKVIIDMVFNLGIIGFLGFRRMIAALERGDYEKAADEMVMSRWYQQVGARGKRLERMMRTGEDYGD